ncbi:hypothetical protein V6N13_107799 [Hibiscus sabdariffa]|uniref:Reverse transcriptase zinc-binding domain-containing protein n=1 Tax=Hibiscus sabdariffa TaxID=183260 RepID=A0ABR2SR99_9ROSI
MPFEWLVQLVPPLKNRAFSISSSPLTHPDQVHLTVDVVSWTTPFKRKRRGLCSTWLASIDPEQSMNVLSHSSDFFAFLVPTNDPWLPGPGDGRLNSEVINISYTIVSDLVDTSTGSWKYGVIEDLFEGNIRVRIRSIPLSSLNLPDELIWRHDGIRVYTMKNGYRLLLDEHDTGSAIISDSLSCFYNILWSTNLPAKILITMWQVVNNFLLTFANLQLRQLNVCNICPLCQHLNESVEHFMRNCPPELVVKFNFDSAFSSQAKTATSRVLGRNTNSLIMAGCSVSHRDVADAFIAEALPGK